MSQAPSPSSITRRRWLLEIAAVAALPAALRALEAGEDEVPFADCDQFVAELRPANPRVKNYDLRRLTQPLTPNEDFFVFHQTEIPVMDAATWKLDVGGMVERPQSYTLQDLARRPRQEVEFTMECSGNLPRPEMMNGQVGNARWSGFSLTALLEECGVRPEAREVVFFGADQMSDPSGEIVRRHGRSVFVQDALDPDALLATTMNGEPLSPAHGFPLRLILPGWYGMAQIKWLTRIEVLDRRYEGLHMSRNYQSVRTLAVAEGPPLVLETSISRTRLKSVVARVIRRRGAAENEFRISGAAWGGPVSIARVEVRIDMGPWEQAPIVHRGGRHAWLLWSLDWKQPRPGRHILTSRAIDADGRIQPTADERRREIRSTREDNA